MPVGVGGANVIGVARETTVGTYVAPVKFMHVMEESLMVEDPPYTRRPKVGIVDPSGVLKGWSSVSGDVKVEVIHTEMAWWLYAMRGNVGKTGSAPNFVYTLTPTHIAQPANLRSFSITIERNGAVFGYVGCVVSSVTFTLEEGILVATFSIVGLDEATQAAPTETYDTTRPFEAGEYDIKIATVAKTDMDNFELTIDDAAEPIHRLIEGQRKPAFTKWGERTVNATLERDFIDKTDYTTFRNKTAQLLECEASDQSNPTNRFVKITMRDAVTMSYEVGTGGGQADLVRAAVEYQATYNAASSQAYNIAVGTSEDIT